MNRMRNQFLARAGLSLDKNRGIRGRNPFDLFEYRLQSRTIAYHLLESALVRYLITTRKPLDSPHRKPPGARTPSLPGLILQSRSNTVEQQFIIKRFGEELHRAGP